MEVTIESEMISIQQRTKNKIATYKKKLNQHSGLSKYRMRYLKKTIELLIGHGRVYLVRLPVHDAMLEIEDQLIPGFDELILKLSQDYGIDYINGTLLRNDYQYTDGNHLDIASAKAFSKYLAEQINEE